MSNVDVVIKAGDRLPILTRGFVVNDAPVILTGASVRFKARPAAGGALVIDRAATIANPGTGIVEYAWTAEDAQLPAGFYFAWFEATIQGKTLSAPNDGFLTLQIAQTIGTFTYSGDPSARPLDLVRFLLSDVNSSDPLLTDAEIEYLLSAWGDSYEAARAGAETIAAKYAGLADSTSKSVGDVSLSQSYSQVARKYTELAASLLARRMRLAPPKPLINKEAITRTGGRFSQPTTDFSMGQFDDNVF